MPLHQRSVSHNSHAQEEASCAYRHPANLAGPPIPHRFHGEATMVARRVYDNEKHIHFVTFSCYKRRKYLQTDLAKQIVIGQLGSRIALHNGV
jgi:hypothetical protein